MITTLIRTGILYVFTLFAIRCVGKNGLSSSDPFQIVMMLMIAELSSLPMESADVPIINGIAAVATILALYSVSAFLVDKSERLKLIINGKPSILIDNGAINFTELKKCSITITDLAEMLRLKNAAELSDVLYAYLETNGEFSVIMKPEKMPPTREDLGIVKKPGNMPCILISDGTVYTENLVKTGITESALEEIIFEHELGGTENILLCFCDSSGKMFLYDKRIAGNIPPVIIDNKGKE